MIRVWLMIFAVWFGLAACSGDWMSDAIYEKSTEGTRP
jgi:hypothetical protein